MTTTNKTYWRSLAELEGSVEFHEAVNREFPPGAQTSDGFDRRRFLQVMGGSIALAGAQSCRWEKTTILPLAERPEDRIPGVPNFYATSLEFAGVAQPLVMTSYDGRPIKVEGNDLHGASGGAASTFAQAALLDLYDPSRSTAPVEKGEPRTMAQFEEAFAALRAKHASSGGAGLALLVDLSSSPALAEAKKRLAAALPRATVTAYEPLSNDRAREGARLAFGRPLRTHFDLSKAKRIACFDADLLGDHPAALANSRAFSLSRRPEGATYDGADFSDRGTQMNRLYVVEPRFTTTGASADHRLPLRAEQVAAALTALEAALVAKGLAVPASWGEASVMPQGALFASGSHHARFIEALAQDLYDHRGASVVAVGGTQARGVHALAHRINALLGNVGTTVTYTEEADAARPEATEALRELVQRMNGKEVETLVVIGGNPVYDAPRALDFTAALGRVATTVHVSLYRNETSRLCAWHAPLAHTFESWSDALTWDGSYCVVQPLIRPIFAGRSVLELVAFLADGVFGEAQALARAGCVARTGAKSDKEWQRAIHDGFVASSAAAAVQPAPQRLAPLALAGGALSAGVPADGQLELVLHGDACVYDGRFANNAWLQELPDFMTKLTWDNAALVSPATSKALGLTTNDLVTLTVGGKSIEAVVYVMVGQAAGCVSLALGYGRTAAGLVGGDSDAGVPTVGFDAYALTTNGTDGHETGLSIKKTGRTYPLSLTADHHMIDATGAKERDGEWLDPTQTYADRFVEDENHNMVALTTPALVERFNAQAKKGSRVSELIKETTAKEYSDTLAAVAKEGGRAAIDANKAGGHGGHGGSHGADAGHGAANDHASEVLFTPGEAPADDHGHGGGHSVYLDPNHIKRFAGPHLLSLWERRTYDGHRWGMSIDLSSCTGCNACVVACQSENNIPVVGKEQVGRGREMHWLRIDRYFSGNPDDPQVAHQPLTCIQCEDAPCEQVCPVAATVHSDEGLNDMVYNRCIGTRYCSNNCPLKVRRFNYFNYHRDLKKSSNDLERMVFNPEVTVRARGVMEKCTYCVQRIQNVKIKAKVEGRRPIRDGEIVTACQQTCPADAIRFGDLADSQSVVSKAHASERSYKMLEFLNIRPRTAFLARMTNPNPVLVEA
jgi:molybdopterin-containing oxidoreductase family iron-sulfur binding subunit